MIGEEFISATAAAPLAAKGVAGSKSKPGEMAGKEGDGQGSRRNAPILLSFIIHATPSSAPVPWWRDLGRSPPALDGLDEALVLLGPGSKLAGDMIISTISSLIFH